jgi:hypothetical protein
MSNDLAKQLSRSNLAKPFFPQLALVFLSFNLLGLLVYAATIAIHEMLNERVSFFRKSLLFSFHDFFLLRKCVFI